MDALLFVLNDELNQRLKECEEEKKQQREKECQSEKPKKRQPGEETSTTSTFKNLVRVLSEKDKKVAELPEHSLKEEGRLMYHEKRVRVPSEKGKSWIKEKGSRLMIGEYREEQVRVSSEEGSRFMIREYDDRHYRSSGYHNGDTKKEATKGKKRKPMDPVRGRDMPAELKDHITRNKGGHDIKLVIQKFLHLSDLKRNNHRFSIPLAQIKEPFLTEEEEEFFKQRDSKGKKRSKEIVVIEPTSGRNETVETFTRWEMEKKNGAKTSSSYVLRSTWMEIVERNRLKEHDNVQLWSFRVGSEFHFAMVIVERAKNTGTGIVERQD